jgi:ribonuclease HIII
VEDALRGTGAHLVQEPKSRAKSGGAAASILARKAFVDSVEQLRAFMDLIFRSVRQRRG